MKNLYVLCLLVSGCATSPRALVDNSQSNKPSWVSSSKITWVEGDQVFFRNQYTIRGDERVNGCYQLAKLDAKETLIREIAEDIRGQIDSAQQGISENAELLLSQVRSSEYAGKVVGMKALEQYHERYINSGVERIVCYTLSEINKSDYDAIKRQILYKVADADPQLKKAITSRAIKFFGDEKASDNKDEKLSTVSSEK